MYALRNKVTVGVHFTFFKDQIPKMYTEFESTVMFFFGTNKQAFQAEKVQIGQTFVPFWALFIRLFLRVSQAFSGSVQKRVTHSRVCGDPTLAFRDLVVMA